MLARIALEWFVITPGLGLILMLLGALTILTAVLMALFTLVLLVQLLWPGELGYDRWAGIFAAQWMKVLSFVVVVALAYHAWVGVRDIWMDYVKPTGLRLLLHVLTALALIGCAGWAAQRAGARSAART